MKKPKEWLKAQYVIQQDYSIEVPAALFSESDIKAIQDEAFKAGLDAAKALITIDGNPEVAKDAIAQLRDRIP